MTHDNTTDATVAPLPHGVPTDAGGFDDPEVIALADKIVAEGAASHGGKASAHLDCGPIWVDYGHHASELFDHSGHHSIDYLLTHRHALPHPVLVPANDHDVAVALVSALQDVVAIDAREGGESAREWDGVRWAASNVELGTRAYRYLVPAWSPADVEAVAAVRKLVAVKYIEADAHDSHHVAAAKLMGGKVVGEGADMKLVDKNGKTINSLPVENEAWVKKASTAINVGKLASVDDRIMVPRRSPTSAGVRDWDESDTVLATPSGYLLLDKQHIMPPDPDMLITRVTKARFDPEAAAPNWETFLSEAFPDPEVRDYVQRAVGATLSGTHREDIFFWLSGPGGNGKGIFTDIIRMALGEYATTKTPDILRASRANTAESASPAQMSLRGQRMLLVSELPNAVALDLDRLKDWTGGGSISARPLWGKTTEFPCTFTLWITANGKLTVPPGNPAVFRRLTVIPMPVEFKNTQEEVDKVLRQGKLAKLADPGLRARLEQELDGVLLWAVRGYEMYLQRGLLDKPAAVAAAGRAMQISSSPWTEFVDACLTTDGCTPAHTITLSHVYSAWDKWRDACGGGGTHRPLAERYLFDELAALLPGIARIARQGGGRPAMISGLTWTDEGTEWRDKW